MNATAEEFSPEAVKLVTETMADYREEALRGRYPASSPTSASLDTVVSELRRQHS